MIDCMIGKVYGGIIDKMVGGDFKIIGTQQL